MTVCIQCLGDHRIHYLEMGALINCCLCMKREKKKKGGKFDDTNFIVLLYRVNISYPTYKGSKYDASTTNFTYVIESGSKSSKITLSFLSPITPTSTLRQSIPASYITLFARGELDINIYIDVNGQWVTKDPSAVLEWKYQDIGDKLKSWAVQRQTQLLFSEFNSQQNPKTPTDHGEWGTLYFVGPEVRKNILSEM